MWEKDEQYRSLAMGNNGKKKIAWLYSHLQFWTGGTRFVLEVSKRLQRYYDIKIIVEKASSEIKEEFERNGIKIKEIGFLTSTSPLYWLLFPWMLRTNERRIRQETADADVIIAGIFPMNVVAAKLNKPVIQNCWEPFAFFYDRHTIRGFVFYKQILIHILSTLYSHLDIAATRESDIVITLNCSTEKLIKDVYKRSAIKAYMGVDIDFFKPIPPEYPAGKDGSKIILHSTDYTEMKGTRYLIEALPLVAGKINNIKLLVTHTVENPKEKEYLIRMAKRLGVAEHIEFTGTIPYSKLPEYYSMADVVVFTGHPESVGTTASLTVLEAMACERPVVRSIGCDEEVEDGISGMLVDPRDKSKLADAIIKLLLDDALAKNMGKEGRRKVSKLYNWNTTCKAFSDAIEALTAKNQDGFSQ